MPRALEILLAGVLLLLSLPFLLAAAALVLIEFGRPVMFRQTRAGKGGRAIDLAKLRTMHEATDATGKPLPDEMRLTAIGRAIRRSRLDEVPQLIAVLRGDLALVGPRPLLPATVAGFGADGVRRGTVRPGLTGWAQVSGNTMLENAEKLALDLWYVGNRSTGLDLRILWLTSLTLLRGESRDEARISAACKAARA